MIEESQTDRQLIARGNLVIQRIVEEQGEGIVISWASPNLKPTFIDSSGDQLPLYDFVKKLIPDFTKARGKDINVVVDDEGNLEGLGQLGQPPSVLIAKAKQS